MAGAEYNEISGSVFDIQRFSLHDGPGVRTTVFLKGCPLSCVWCHNPEGYKAATQLLYDSSRCIGCGECAAACPSGAHKIENSLHFFDRSKCLMCTACADVCPTAALEVAGKIYTAGVVISEVLRDKKYYTAGGGMTVSGGEPLMQSDFTYAILHLAHKNGIHTALETSGYAEPDVFEKVAREVDLLLLDYKLSGDEEHLKYTGVSRKKIDANADAADKMGIPVVLRCPIIPGVNDNEKHYAAIARYADKLKSVMEIDIEPYHTIGVSKYDLLGEKCPFETEQITFEAAQEIADTIGAMTDKKVKVSK